MILKVKPIKPTYMAKEKQPKVEQDQEVNDAQMKTEAEAKAIIENNLRFYSQGCEVPADALKPIRAGRLKGMSDVNPMWRMKRMTEIFRSCRIRLEIRNCKAVD